MTQKTLVREDTRRSADVTGQLICLWTVPVAVVILLIGFLSFPGLFPPMSPMMTADQVAAFYSENTTMIGFSMITHNLFGIMLVPFFMVIVIQMKRMATPNQVLASGGELVLEPREIHWQPRRECVDHSGGARDGISEGAPDNPQIHGSPRSSGVVALVHRRVDSRIVGRDVGDIPLLIDDVLQRAGSAAAALPWEPPQNTSQAVRLRSHWLHRGDVSSLPFTYAGVTPPTPAAPAARAKDPRNHRGMRKDSA